MWSLEMVRFGEASRIHDMPRYLGMRTRRLKAQQHNSHRNHVIEDLMDVFRRLPTFVETYAELDRSYWQKANWWTVGRDEAVQLAPILSRCKTILITRVAILHLN